MIADLLPAWISLPWLGTVESLALYAVMAGLGVYRLRTRRSVYIRPFTAGLDVDADTSRIERRIHALMSEYEAAHTRSSFEAAGARSGLGQPRLASEVGGAAAAKWYLLEHSRISLFYSILNWVLPVPELEGELLGDAYPRTIQARIRRGGLFRSEVLAHAKAELADPSPAAFETAIAKLTYGLILRLSTAARGFDRRAEAPGTDSWAALQALTRALHVWGATEDLPDAQVIEVEGLLTRALEEDPTYALAHYNLGVLCYKEKAGARGVDEAIEHFEEANAVAEKRFNRDANVLLHDADARIWGLAAIGLARACSTKVHRYFHMQHDPDEDRAAAVEAESRVLAKAREAGARACLNLPKEPQAIYAKAYARHCVVSDGLTDTELELRAGYLEAGGELYQSLVRPWRLPGWRKKATRLVTVHNNLGYVLMMSGQILANQARDAAAAGSEVEARRRRKAAEAKWRLAEKHMQIVVEVAPANSYTRAYSLANLGNVCRLRGGHAQSPEEYVTARDYYERSFEAWTATRALHPETGGPEIYVDGHAEYARLRLESDPAPDRALAVHEKALRHAQSSAHRFKIGRMFLIAMEGKGLLAEPDSIDAARIWLSDREEPTVEGWMAGLRGILERAATPAADPVVPDAASG